MHRVEDVACRPILPESGKDVTTVPTGCRRKNRPLFRHWAESGPRVCQRAVLLDLLLGRPLGHIDCGDGHMPSECVHHGRHGCITTTRCANGNGRSLSAGSVTDGAIFCGESVLCCSTAWWAEARTKARLVLIRQRRVVNGLPCVRADVICERRPGLPGLPVLNIGDGFPARDDVHSILYNRRRHSCENAQRRPFGQSSARFRV